MKKILILLLFTVVSYGQFAKVGGTGTNALLDNGAVGTFPLPAPFVATNSTNAKINGELNVGQYATLKINTSGTLLANPNNVDYTAFGSQSGAGWNSAHRFYTSYGSTLVPALTMETATSTTANSSFFGNVSINGSTTSTGLLTSSGVSIPSTAPYIINAINGNPNSPFKITNTYNSTGNFDTIVNFDLISTAGGGYANAFSFKLRPNNTPINETVEMLKLSWYAAPLVSLGANTSVSGNITTTQYRLSSLNTAPSSATDTGTLGEIRITANYVYVCIATNTWVRTALSTW